ncbi:MAG: NifB/NifX family molybdenum-iron cluster-binding protein [Candidatus Natronoplasma sp.]
MAVSADGKNEEANIDDRFARCPYFMIVDTDGMGFEALENEDAEGAHGVAPQVVQTLSEIEIDAVITKNLGPNGYRTLESADIEVYKGSGKVLEAVEKLKNGELEEFKNETVEGHFGKGR